MKILKFNSEQEWLDARKGKVTGTRLKDLILKRSTKPKKGFYEIIAERVALPPNGENVMDRGHRLEVDGIVRFEQETGKVVDKSLVMMCRDDDENIAYSPDGFIENPMLVLDENREDCEHSAHAKKCGRCGGLVISEDVEVKCLNSASHIEVLLTKEIPSEYEEQIIQGFIVNDKLQTRYMVFYDPRMPVDFFYLTIQRKDMQVKVDEYLKLERETLKQIAEIEAKLTF